MIKGIIAFSALLLSLSSNVFSQDIDLTKIKASKDTVLERVIAISENDLVKIGANYLFTVPMVKTSETPILFISENIPSSQLMNIYPEFSQIMVIMPNWQLYKTSTVETKEGINCGEPMASSIVYLFDRTDGVARKDSVVLLGWFPKMKMLKTQLPGPKQTVVYYTESYGSQCCPRDQQWDNDPKRDDFVSQFEGEHKTTIGDAYYKVLGKEGEKYFYYTLNGLSHPLKLKFILERSRARVINRHLKGILEKPEIYTPRVLEFEKNVKKIK